MKMISNCCGAADRLQSEDGPSFSDVGICPKCKEHCEFEKETEGTKGDVKVKITKTASGKSTVKMSRKEWEGIGKTAGWWSDLWEEKSWSQDRGGSPGISQEDRDFYDNRIVECKGCNLKMRAAYVDKNGICKDCHAGMKEDVQLGQREDQALGM